MFIFTTKAIIHKNMPSYCCNIVTNTVSIFLFLVFVCCWQKEKLWQKRNKRKNCNILFTFNFIFSVHFSYCLSWNKIIFGINNENLWGIFELMFGGWGTFFPWTWRNSQKYWKMQDRGLGKLVDVLVTRKAKRHSASFKPPKITFKQILPDNDSCQKVYILFQYLEQHMFTIQHTV
jgi:hypothetical protein